MNFTLAPKPSELSWGAPRGNGKTQTASATFGGRRLSIQTPPCATRMFREASSTTLYMVLDTQVHRSFRAFVERLEAYAADLPFARDLAMSSSIRERPGEHPSFRLNVWETQWFDEGGTFLKEPPMRIDGCSCILEFQGCWVGQTSWGLKWRVQQVRLEEAKSSSSSSTAKSGTGPKPYAFLE